MSSHQSHIKECNLFWSATPESIKERTAKLITEAKQVYESVGKVEHVNFNNIVSKLAHHEAVYATERNMLDFFQHVSADEALRTASTESDKELSDLEVELSMNKEVFDKIVELSEHLQGDLSAESKRYVERKVILGKRNGLHLDKPIRKRIEEIKKEENTLSIDFQKNLGEEKSILEFAEEELVGVPDDFIQSLEKTEDGKRKVTLKYPHYFPCIEKARNPETRRKLETAFNSRCIKENAPIFEKLIQLRHERAKLLSFTTHSDYVLEMRMAKSAANVAQFLTELGHKLEPLRDKELATFLAFKKAECEQHGYPFSGRLDPWDLRYYMNLHRERDFAVDQQHLKEYFPMDVVTKGLLTIYQLLLGLKFDLVETKDVWHPEVTMYSVSDADSSRLIGYFYLDLYPRDGKYGHAAVFGLQNGCSLDSNTGSRQLPVAAMVANFTKPTADRPALLLHDEVETFFHEFGHLMHHICSEAEYAMFSGTHVERDFVECPSQMLENWCWEEEPMRHLSAHFRDGSPMPAHLLDKLVQSRVANAGVFNMRQIVLASFDQSVHTTDKADAAQVYADLNDRYLRIRPSEGTNMPATFGHMAGGYDAQYYGYLWSEVFSADLFASRFKKEGIMNPGTGADYRRLILAPGGSKDAADILRDFLGREPNQEAFLRMKGL